VWLVSTFLLPVADIYGDNDLLALFSGFVAPTRYFIEGLTVAEYRCLPEQSGYTQTAAAINFPQELNSFALLGLAQNDSSVREQSCSGWYWGALPALLVGLTIRWVAAGAIHVSERSKQAKKPLLKEMKHEAGQNDLSIFKSTRMFVAVFFVVFAALFSLSSWTIVRGASPPIPAPSMAPASPPAPSTATRSPTKSVSIFRGVEHLFQATTNISIFSPQFQAY
jgi:hypothetical protein